MSNPLAAIQASKAQQKELEALEVPKDEFDEDEHNKKVQSIFAVNKWFKKIFRIGGDDHKDFKPVLLTDAEYIRIADNAVEEGWSFLQKSSGWKKEKTSKEDTVESLENEKHGKIFKLTAVVDCPAKFFFVEVRDNYGNLPTWNPAMLESKIIRKITDEVDLTYMVSAGGGAGAVKPRDFVSVRKSVCKNGVYMICGYSLEYPGFPPHATYIRGENTVGVWAMEDVTLEDGKMGCKFQWLMACDLKGWLPKYVIDIAFTTAMLEFIETLRNFLDKKRAEGAIQ